MELEYRYTENTVPRGVVGLAAAIFKEYPRFIANRPCRIGIDASGPAHATRFRGGTK